MNELLAKLATLIRGDVVIIQKLFDRQIQETSSLKSEVSSLAKAIQDQKPVINVPKPHVTIDKVEVPPIKIPEIKAPEVKIPPITVPKPEVKVTIPPIKLPKPEKPVVNVQPPKVEVKVPKEMTVEGFKEFARQILALLSAEGPQHTSENPMPVILVDKDGKEYRAGAGSVSVTGGGSGSEDPLEKYKIADLDDAGTTKYYGFTDRDGHWYILKEDTTAKTYRYIAGPDDYDDSWTGRATLSYDYFHNVF